jgi:hypothetical protein
MNTKRLLFERMSYLNPDFKKPEYLSESDEEIINDILSTNEGVGNDWWNKFINYGKKGLLTTGIILAVALSTQASNSNKTDDVIKSSVEFVNNPDDIINVYNYMIGASMMMGHYYKKQMDIDKVKAADEVIYYYMTLRNKNTPPKLSKNAINFEKHIKDMYNKYKNDDSKMEMIINKGRNLKKFTYTH